MDNRYSETVSSVCESKIREIFESASDDIINLALGEPDIPTPKYIREGVKNAIDKGFTHYTSNKGTDELREKISIWVANHGYYTDIKDVIVTSGASEALHLAAQTFISDGDDVLIPDPGFVSYKPLVKIAGGNPVPVITDKEYNFKLTAKHIEDFLTPDTSVIFLNSPSNPTGTLIDNKDIKKIVDISEDNNIIIISDEVYSEMIYNQNKISYVSPRKYSDNIVVVNAFSKCFAMTGWRLGFVISNNEDIREMLKVHQYIQACASSISQKAGEVALNNSQRGIDIIYDKLSKRREFMLQRLEDIDGLKYIEPEGAMYVFANISEFGSDIDIVRHMADEGVLAVPGRAFGPNPDNKDFIRLSFSASEEEIDSGLSILNKIIREECF